MAAIVNPTLLKIPAILGLRFEIFVVCFLIAVALFFFWRNLIKVSARNALLLSIVPAAIPFIYLGLIAALFTGICYTPIRNFDQAQWIDNSAARFEMAGDIIKSNMLMGKSTDQLRAILGNPSSHDDSIYVYDMGEGDGGLGFMFHHAILFAQGETLAKTRLYQMAINSFRQQISQIFEISEFNMVPGSLLNQERIMRPLPSLDYWRKHTGGYHQFDRCSICSDQGLIRLPQKDSDRSQKIHCFVLLTNSSLSK